MTATAATDLPMRTLILLLLRAGSGDADPFLKIVTNDGR
jgi:hypothetical protein